MPIQANVEASFHADFQADFQRRWPQLRDPHVRALAWLLDAPDLMAPEAPCWSGRIASLGPVSARTAAWLQALQDDPAPLHQHLAQQPTARLGRYAEQLLGYYLHAQGQLVAANLQVRDTAPGRATLGEFDFLVRRPETGGVLEHWEFATKFYLLQPADATLPAMAQDAFLGPNLADSLGRKMRKIMEQQLRLASHPAAAAVLPAAVARVGALVKGWLFYRGAVPAELQAIGIAQHHCAGSWCTLEELPALWPGGWRFVVLPRLAWLAPARVDLAFSLDWMALQQQVSAHFAKEPAPLLVAICREEGVGREGGEDVIEIGRTFVVPPDWARRAEEQAAHSLRRI